MKIHEKPALHPDRVFLGFQVSILADDTQPRPNILIIFTGDQGYADFGCFGPPTHKTPRMDQLAKEGTMFTDFYAQSVCGPSRSALLAGRYPLRDGKGSCYEAGARVPCIIRWPGKVAAGASSSAIFSTLDLLPTFANLAGFEVPKDRFIDGVDQTGLLLGKIPAGNRGDFFYVSHISRQENTCTVNGMRKGKWKFLKAEHVVSDYAVDTDRGKVPELYDLEADIGENNNLAEKHPEIIEQMENETNAFWYAEK